MSQSTSTLSFPSNMFCAMQDLAITWPGSGAWFWWRWCSPGCWLATGALALSESPYEKSMAKFIWNSFLLHLAGCILFNFARLTAVRRSTGWIWSMKGCPGQTLRDTSPKLRSTTCSKLQQSCGLKGFHGPKLLKVWRKPLTPVLPQLDLMSAMQIIVLKNEAMLECVTTKHFATTEPCLIDTFCVSRGGKSHSKPLVWDVAVFESNPTGIQL